MIWAEDPLNRTQSRGLPDWDRGFQAQREVAKHHLDGNANQGCHVHNKIVATLMTTTNRRLPLQLELPPQ